jgi:hypothetical protein
LTNLAASTGADPLLRSSFFSQWPLAAFLVTADLPGVWLLLDACGFHPVLARGWHGAASCSPTVGMAEVLADAPCSVGRRWLLKLASARAGCCTWLLYGMASGQYEYRQGCVDIGSRR